MTVASLPSIWDVPVTIAAVAGDGTTTTTLVNRVNAQVQIKRQGEWTVTWDMPGNDPQASLIPKLGRVRVSLALNGHSATLFDATIRKRRRVVTHPDEEYGQKWSITAYEYGNDIAKRRMRIYPALGMYEPVGRTYAQRHVGHRPFGQNRTFGWPDPACTQFVDEGIAATQLYQQANFLPFPIGRSGAPFGWIDSDAWWIWSEPIGGDLKHDLGSIYGHKTFDVAEETDLIIDSAGDDSYEIWLNGQLLIDRAKEPDLSTWQRLARTTVKVGPGTQTIRFRCTNEAPDIETNVGGFICAAYDADDGTLLCATDSSWLVIPYPTYIGMTPAEILKAALVDEPTSRSFDAALIPSLNFGMTTDTAGQPLSRIAKWPVKVGSKVQELIDGLAAAWIEYQWVSGQTGSGYRLDIYNAEGAPLINGSTAGDPSTNYATGNLLDGATGNSAEITIDESTEDLFNNLLFLWQEGFSEWGNAPVYGTDGSIAASIAAYGRHEGFLGVGDQADSQAALFTAVQNTAAQLGPQPTVSATLSDGCGRFRADVPMVNYGLFNYVGCPQIDDPGTPAWVRLQGLTITEDQETGTVRLVPSYFTNLEIWHERIDRWLQRFAQGGQSGQSDVASPDSPDVITTEVIQPRKETFSGDVATVGSVATPWTPTETVGISQALALAASAGGSDTIIAVTINETLTSPLRYVEIPGGDKAGFSQYNFPYLMKVSKGATVNVFVTADGGHQKISVDLLYFSWPFKS